MAKTSKGVILSQASQIKSDYSFALIKATSDNKSLVQDASSAELKVNALVEYSKDSQWDPKKLTSLGFPAGCFLIVDLRGQDIHAADLITNLALVRQYGYQAGAIDDLSTLDDIKALKANQIYLINSGKTNDDQDASLNGNEITDGSGKLAVGMSVKWQRDYTNVDVSGDHAGFVGMGQDTLLKGGNAFGYSTNGRDFNAVITPKGLIFRRPDAERMWRLLKPNEIADINSTVGDKVKKEVDSATAEIPAAVSAANSAVSAAESAVAASKVNSDAIVAQSSAVVEAKSAMDSATAEIQQTAANAASDAAKIRADVARVQNEVDTAKAANSASVEALKSDINTAKQDLANVHDSLTKAQSAVEQNQKLINDSVAKISNDIAQDRKDLATAQQNNADLAKQLDDYSKQAEAQGETIKSIQDKQDSFTATLADVQGNVSQVSDKVDGLSASLKDTQGNVATVKAQADQLNVTLTDHAKSIATLTASAKELSSTLEDADGRLSKVEQTAQTNSSTLSDVQGDLSQVKQQADGLVTTLKDAQGSITQIQQKADGTAEQLSNAQGDITALQKDVSGIKLTIADHDKNIHTLQADSKALKDDMADAKGNISSLQKTSTSLVSEFKDHDGRISKVEQTASELNNEFSDQQGHLNRVEQTANGTQQTVANQQGQINMIKTDASGIRETLTGQSDQIANLNVTLNGLNTKYDGVSGDLSKLSDKVTTNSTQIDQDKKLIALKADQSTVDNLSGEVSQNEARLKVQAGQISSKVSSEDFKTLDNKVGGAIAQIDKNTTAIDQTNKEISLKADQTTVDKIKNTASQNSSRIDVMANEISSKVTSTDVNNIVNGKGYATTSTVQSLITQKAGTINESITNLDSKYNATVTQVQSLTASIDGIQGVVKNKADQSTVTQLANTYQVKLTGNLLASLGKKAQKYTVGNNTFFPFASIDVTKVTKGTVLTLSFDYSSDADCAFVPQLDGTPWIPWGDIKDNPISVKANVPGHYVKQITVGDDSWTKGTAKNIAIRIDNFGGTFTVSNLTLRSGDNVASTFDMLQYDMDLRVQKGDLLSQINLEAGRTLLQSKKIFMDADTVVMGPNTRAFIPSAAIINLDAAKIDSGYLHTDKVSIGDDTIKLNVADSEMSFTGSSVNTSYSLALQGNAIIYRLNPNQPGFEYRIAHGVQKYETDEDGLDFDVAKKNVGSNKTVMGLSASGVMISPSLFFQTDNIDSPNWMGFTRNTVDGNTAVSFHTWDDNNEGFHVDCGARFMNYVYINGYARAQGWLTNSTLSKKTNIRKLDLQTALDKIRQDDQYLYEYKRNVAKGIYDPQASFIIDDVNDVAQYSVPREFIDQTGNYREPNVELAYLVAAFQALDKQVQEQNETIKKLEAKLNE